MALVLEHPQVVPPVPDEERVGLDCKPLAGQEMQRTEVSLLPAPWQLYLRAEMSGSVVACDLEAVSSGSGVQ
jgi:hypothetical protein